MALTFDFAFEGFRTIRERPKLILFWGATALFGNGVGVVLLVALSGPALATLVGIGTKPIDDALRLDLLRRIMPGIGAWLPVHLLTQAVVNGAVCRAGLRGGDDRFGFLRFGLDEIRILLVSLAGLLMAFGMVFAAALVAQAGAMTVPGSAAGLQSAGLLAAGFGVIWLYVRLSLNIPQSFAARRVDVFGSFALTHGRFWTLFWGYAAAVALTLCVAFLCDKIVAAVLGVAFGEKAAEALPDMTSLDAFLTPQTIVRECLTNGLVSPLLLAIMLGAPVAAYRSLVPVAGPAALREPV